MFGGTYLIDAFLHLSAQRREAGRNRKCREVPKNSEKHTENQCFEHFLGDQYGANLAWCIFYAFLPSHVGAQDGLAETIKHALSATVFGLFLSEVYANM